MSAESDKYIEDLENAIDQSSSDQAQFPGNLTALQRESLSDQYCQIMNKPDPSDSQLDSKEANSGPPSQTPTKVELKAIDSKILCSVIIFQSLLTLISFSLAFSSMFRKDPNLSMERSSYWWYFLFCTFILVYLLSTYGLICGPNTDRMSLLNCLLLSVIVVFIEMFLITRFLFITFPIPDINWRLEPIALIVVSCLRLVFTIILMAYIVKYLNSNPDKLKEELDLKRQLIKYRAQG